MCTISIITDFYINKRQPLTQPTYIGPTITQEEIDEFHKLLERAREYDKKHNEPDCELQEKKDILLALALALAEKLNMKISFD